MNIEIGKGYLKDLRENKDETFKWYFGSLIKTDPDYEDKLKVIENEKHIIVFYVSVNDMTDSILCDDYLYCSLYEFQKKGIEYKAKIVYGVGVTRPLFFSEVEARIFLDDWVYPRLIMKQLAGVN